MVLTAPAQAMADGFRNAALSTDEKLSALREASTELPDDQKKALAQGLLAQIKPSQKTADILYLIIISALLVILLTAAGIIFGLFGKGANVDQVLGIFTTILSFILGLFAPSPVEKA